MCCDGLLALFPGSSPAFCRIHKTGREPGRSDNMHDDLLCVVLCMVFELCPRELNRAGCLTVTALQAAQHDSKETLKGHNKQL